MTFSKLPLAALALVTVMAAPVAASAHTLSLGADADSSTSVSIPGIGSQTGVAVNSSGNVAVGGAKVTSVSGSTIDAQSSWGSAVLNWIINTSSSTKFAAKGSATTTNNVKVGDTISFFGMIDQAMTAFTVNAKLIFDRSASTTASTTPRHQKDNEGKHWGWFNFLFGVRTHVSGD